jgi:hypothetical protein
MGWAMGWAMGRAMGRVERSRKSCDNPLRRGTGEPMRRIALAPCLLLAACGGEQPPTAPAIDDGRLAAPAEDEGYQLSMEATAPAGEEVWLCQIGKFPGQGVNHIDRVVSKQSTNMHHMDVMILAFTDVDLPPGLYDCKELYAEYESLMEEGMIVYGAQAADQALELPEGISAPIPGSIPIMQEIHYVNTSTEDVEVFSDINVYLMDVEEVTGSIWGSVVRDTHLTIPANSEHSEWTRCVMNEDVDLLFIASHTHELGESVQVRTFDGEKTGDLIYENLDWESPFVKDYTEETLTVPKGSGFEFTCHFDNHRPEEVNWGFSSQDEMCQIALVYTPGDDSIACEVVESSDGVIDSASESNSEPM